MRKEFGQNPELRLNINLLPNEFELNPNPGHENELTTLLAFFGALNNRWAIIDYTYCDEPQRITTPDLKKDELDELTYHTLLINKVDELIASTDIKVRIINPDDMDIENLF